MTWPDAGVVIASSYQRVSAFRNDTIRNNSRRARTSQDAMVVAISAQITLGLSPQTFIILPPQGLPGMVYPSESSKPIA